MTNVEFTAETVRGAQFREKLKGYHPEEVDAFLERAAAALEQLSERLTEMTERALKAETALAQNSETDESVRRTLVLAQRTAEMAVREANDEAQRLRVESRNEADRIIAEAREEAARLAADTDAMAQAARAEAEDVRTKAIQHATATVDDADASARETVAAAQAEAERIRSEAEAAVAAFRADAEREAMADIADRTRALHEQYDLLWADVERLSAFLAGERARAFTAFDETLRPLQPPARQSAPREEPPVEPPVEPSGEHGPEPVDEQPPADPEAAADPEEPDADGPAEAEAQPDAADPASWEWPGELAEAPPETEPVTAWFEGGDAPSPSADAAPAAEEGTGIAGWTPSAWDHEEPPARLLFTLDDEVRRESDREDAPVEGKIKRSLLGRRKG